MTQKTTNFYKKTQKIVKKPKIFNKITISRLAREWLAEKRAEVKRSTFSTYSILINRHIIPYFATVRVEDVDIQQFVSDKTTELSSKTIKDLLIILKMIFRYANRKYGVVCPEVAVKFKFSVGEAEAFSIDEHRQILNYIRGNFTLKNLGIYIVLTTGMRIGEVCALRWADIDTREGVIRVTKTLQRVYDPEKRCTQLVLDSPKTSSSVREIPICFDLLRVLRPLSKVVSADNFVLTNTMYPLEPRTYREHYRRVLKNLGIKYRKFHILRHSFATRCIESNCDYKTLSALLGHTSIATTLNLYVHPNTAQKRKCIHKMLKSLNI